MQPKKKQKLDDPHVLGYTEEDFIRTQLYELYRGLKQSNYPASDQIKSFLLNLKPTKKKTIEEAYNSLQDKKSIWPLPKSIAIPNGKFKFMPPVSVVEVGGVSTCTHWKSTQSSDLLLTLSEEFCEPKDYLNGRYIVKRTLFLMQLIPKIRNLDFVSVIKFKYFNKDVLKPVLLVKLKTGESFHLIPSGCIFKPSLLEFDMNAIRPAKVGVVCSESSTPYYNNSILTDMYSLQYANFLSVIQDSTNLQQALTILKYWSERKRIGVSGHILTTILLHLHQSGAVTAEMDLLTLCRQTWSYLSSNFISAYSAGIVVGSSSQKAGRPGLYIDTSANVCYNTDQAALRELVRHSQVMTRMLQSRDYNTLISVLSDRVSSLFDIHDVVYKVEIPDLCVPQYSLQYCGVQFLGFIDHLRSVLSQSYGDRVKEIKIECSLNESWSRKSPPTLPTTLMIGLTIDQNNWTRVVDRGPSADTAESKAFKEFWGERSNIRRFQDGSIVQAVVWAGKTAQERRNILTQITEYVLQRHAGISPDQLMAIQLDSREIVGKPYYMGAGEEQALKIISTFSELSKILRKCSKIPLTITSVLGVSPVFRNTDLYPQQEYQVGGGMKGAAPPYVKAHDVSCHFELSGKWPEDVRGILRLKAAFYLALKEELQSMHIAARASIDFIDIARNGFVFRLRCRVPKEEKLRAGNISFWVPCSGSDLQVQTVISPAVSCHLASLSMQHSAYPLTVRFLKRWVAAHLLSHYIPDIFCELVVAHTFLDSSSPPQTATAAFLRVLTFLSSFDWSLYPLLLNFNEELSSNTVDQYNNFMNKRSSYPDACIVCPQNELSDLTRHSPTTSTLNILKHLAVKSDINSLDSLFRPKSTAYNVIIHLKGDQTGRCDTREPRQHHAKSSQFPVVGYEPAQLYVEELTRAYGELCLFLYNRYAPTEVAVVLKHSPGRQLKFTVNGSMAKVKTPSGLVRDNLDAMLSDFDLMGKGLVQSIEVLNLET